jgi:hypothetical protein
MLDRYAHAIGKTPAGITTGSEAENIPRLSSSGARAKQELSQDVSGPEC